MLKSAPLLFFWGFLFWHACPAKYFISKDVILKAAHDATSEYKKFREAMKTQQKFLRETENFPIEPMGRSQINNSGKINSEKQRFVQLFSKSKGNVDTEQIYQSLYMTQQLRKNPAIILNLKMSEEKNGSRESWSQKLLDSLVNSINDENAHNFNIY